MHLTLSNSEKTVQICEQGLSFLTAKSLTDGWRLHSAGYAVLQFVKQGKLETLYLHKLLAKEFRPKPQTTKRLFVRMINANKLDCRVENIEWATMSELRRHQNAHKSQHMEAYRGVSKDGSKYRAVIYDKGQRIYLGLFRTPEEAARAYNRESLCRFGITNSLNQLDNPQFDDAPNPISTFLRFEALRRKPS
jgi:hypothetical protein